MHDIISVLDKYVDRGSELWLYNEVNCHSSWSIQQRLSDLQSALLSVSHLCCLACIAETS